MLPVDLPLRAKVLQQSLDPVFMNTIPGPVPRMEFNGQIRVCNKPRQVQKLITFLLGKKLETVTTEDKIMLGTEIRFDYLRTVKAVSLVLIH